MTNFARAKQRRFIELLYKKTAARKLDWKINEDYHLYTIIAQQVLFVSVGTNEFGESIVIFSVFEEDGGKKSDGFNDDSLSFDDDKPDGFESWYQICKSIYEIGKRQASGADDAIDAMIDALDDDTIF